MLLVNWYQKFVDLLKYFEGVAPLALRLYLAPVLMQAGYNKLSHFSDSAAWFGNPDWGLGLPFPELMVSLAFGTELIGGGLLILGLATRLISIPLMVTMLVAAFAVHWDNGWLAIADVNSWLANEQVLAAGDKLSVAKTLLQENGHYEWLTSSGNFVVLNNGIEFSITYLIMLLALLFMGGGRYTSLDYYIAKSVKK